MSFLINDCNKYVVEYFFFEGISNFVLQLL
jgi:hypothetical protein